LRLNSPESESDQVLGAYVRMLQNAVAGNDLDRVQWAAWFQVATVLLNLDETITK